jgi:hypothetical protein
MHRFPSISPTPTHNCKVYRLQIGGVGNQGLLLSYFKGLADGRRSSFDRIFPWDKLNKDKDLIHYVSISGSPSMETVSPPVICGWMTVSPETTQSLYLSEITTRHATDKSYSKVGFSLHQALLEDIAENYYGRVDYIYLLPIDDQAASAYVRWGYHTVHPDLTAMVYDVSRRGSSESFISSQFAKRDADNELENNIILDLRDILDDDLRQLLDDRIADDSNFYRIVLPYVDEISSDPSLLLKLLK